LIILFLIAALQVVGVDAEKNSQILNFKQEWSEYSVCNLAWAWFEKWQL
jgi:hypothetical protein